MFDKGREITPNFFSTGRYYSPPLILGLKKMSDQQDRREIFITFQMKTPYSLMKRRYPFEKFLELVRHETIQNFVFPCEALWDVPEGLQLEDVDDYEEFFSKYHHVIQTPDEIDYTRMYEGSEDYPVLSGPMKSRLRVPLNSGRPGSIGVEPEPTSIWNEKASLKNLLKVVMEHFDLSTYGIARIPVGWRTPQTPMAKASFDRRRMFHWPQKSTLLNAQLYWMNFYSHELVEFLGRERFDSIKDEVASFEETVRGIFIESVTDYNYSTPGHEERMLYLQEKLNLSSVPGCLE